MDTTGKHASIKHADPKKGFYPRKHNIDSSELVEVEDGRKTKPFRTIKDFGEGGDNILNVPFGLSG